ncbi:MAG: four helix bundle protein [Verrucomicrobia bacterium]|nr:MAG: four helix bundle protein [Verrucomicrobiota bacterium]
MKVYDLEDRLLEYSAEIIRLAERLPKTRTGNHIASQIIRSGTSPRSNHGEAQGAESQKDFIHKMGICLKELRETERWLKLILKVPLLPEKDRRLEFLLKETDELIRIFVSSIKTAKTHL